MAPIHLVGTCDTKAAELGYLRDLLTRAGHEVILVDVGTGVERAADVPARDIAACHDAPVLGLTDRGQAVAAMSAAFGRWCEANRTGIGAMIGIGGGGGTSIVAAGMRALPYGVPKLMVSTLASGDVAPYVETSDIVMMPAVTDMAGLNRISRHILHNAAQAIAGMAARPYTAPANSKPGIGLSMFGVTTACVTAIVADLKDHECVVFHATGTGGRSMEQLLAEGMLSGLIDITLTEIADELVGGVLSAGAGRLDVLAERAVPWVGSVGALDMVNFWAPGAVPQRFAERLFHHHNPNVTLMRTTPNENAEIGAWIAAKLNRAKGPLRLLLPEGGISALDTPGGAFHDPAANAALFGALERDLRQTDSHRLIRLPHHINDPAFAAAAAAAFLDIKD